MLRSVHMGSQVSPEVPQVHSVCGHGEQGLKDRWPDRMEVGPMPCWGRQGMSPYTLSKGDTFQKQMIYWRSSRLGRVRRWYQKPL